MESPKHAVADFLNLKFNSRDRQSILQHKWKNGFIIEMQISETFFMGVTNGGVWTISGETKLKLAEGTENEFYENKKKKKQSDNWFVNGCFNWTDKYMCSSTNMRLWITWARNEWSLKLKTTQIE